MMRLTRVGAGVPRFAWRHRRLVAIACALVLVAALVPASRHAVERVLHFHGTLTGTACNQPAGGVSHPHNKVALAATPDGAGYWVMQDDGGIFPYGDALGVGSAGASALGSQMVGMAATPTGRGYWLVEHRGMVWAYGDAGCYGGTYDTGATDIVAIAATKSGRGYWLLEQNGGIWPFGDATGPGCIPCQGYHVTDVVGMARTPSGNGYWIAEANGGIWPYGDACGCGTAGQLAAPVVSITLPPGGVMGYTLFASDGGLFPFGAASPYPGSLQANGVILSSPAVTAVALTMAGRGAWYLLYTGQVVPVGDAASFS